MCDDAISLEKQKKKGSKWNRKRCLNKYNDDEVEEEKKKYVKVTMEIDWLHLFASFSKVLLTVNEQR